MMRRSWIFTVAAVSLFVSGCAMEGDKEGGRPAPGGTTSSVDGGPSGHGDPGAADGNVKAPPPHD